MQIRHLHVIAGLVLAASAPAVAHPTIDAGACTVTIVRAPDEVRAEIDRWVASEHGCKTTLELRALRTDGGYYLWARDGFGREHERVVPDAQTAGVLVASWVADDSYVVAIPIDPLPPGATPRFRSDHVAIDGAPADPFHGGGGRVVDPFAHAGAGVGVATGFAPPGDAPVIAGAARTPRTTWLSLGAAASALSKSVRGELDVRVRDDWSLVLGLAFSKTDYYDAVFYSGIGDIAATLSAARRWTRGRFSLEVSAGGGLTRSSDDDFRAQHGIFPVFELASRVVIGGDHWALSVGPVLSAFARDVGVWGDDKFVQMDASSEVRTLVFAGIRHRL